MDNEIFIDIPGYEGIYQAGSLGSIRSMKYGKVRILSQSISKGYLMVHFQKDGIHKNFLVHRLVALCFHENPNNYPQVNHINGNKLDNRAVNCEWCTSKQNIRHAFDN